jgi:hypothetical protein
MDFALALDSLVPKLAKKQKEKGATPFYDYMSGAFIWSDERMQGLSVNEMGCLRAVSRYRTSLIVKELDQRFESLWEELKRKCPNWIGFEPERCSPNEALASEYYEIKKKPLL